VEYLYTYTKVVVAQRLADEISSSAIATALDYVTVVGAETINLYFKAALSEGDVTILDGIVAAHVPTPIPDTATIVTMEGPKDSDGALLQRIKLTRSGWHYEPRLVSWFTNTAGSLHNRKPDGFSVNGGTDYGDAVIKFYDNTGTALTKGAEESDVDFQTRLDGNCTCTIVDWQSTHDMEVLGGMLRLAENQEKNAYAWLVVAPDLPAQYGGNVPFMTGGLALGMIQEYSLTEFDGRTAKLLTYDPVYKTNKIRVKVVHGLAAKIGVMVRFEIFKA